LKLAVLDQTNVVLTATGLILLGGINSGA